MGVLIWALVLVGIVAPAAGQNCTREQTWTTEPQARDTYAVRFLGRTLTAGSVEIILRKRVTADASPLGMLVAGPTIVGDTVSVALAPNTGCSVGVQCRAGNEYQIRFQATDSEGNTPTANACFVVAAQALRTGVAP